MFHLLIVAATAFETEFLYKNESLTPVKGIPFSINHPNLKITILVTGVGMIATTYSLTKALQQNNFDLVLNIGLAGSFKKEISKGEVVHVTHDLFSEIGAEDDDQFISVFDLGLADKNELPFENGIIVVKNNHPLNSLDKYRKVKGITVNTVHGNEISIQKVVAIFNPDVETMEGAAVLYTCALEKINCIQLRAISNYVEKRNRADWQIETALKNLEQCVNEIINELSQQ